MEFPEQAYHALCCYTLAHGDADFIHQHVVDAYAAQTADEHTKSLTLAFALIGLCLHVEFGFSGRQVQRVHMDLARRKRAWPRIPQPVDRGATTASHVVLLPEGPQRDLAIHEWSAVVWDAFRESHALVRQLLRAGDLTPRSAN